MKFFTTKKKDNVTVNVEIAIAKAAFSEPVTKLEPPAPDLATKPADIVGYCFGYVCPAHHVSETFDSIGPDGYNQRKVCHKCGEVTRPATVKRTAEATWYQDYLPYVGFRDCEWHQHSGYPNYTTSWNKFEFIKFLGDLPTAKTKKKAR